ncbi:MAG: type I DNA topoisomerase [Anaeroplasma sp.]
MNKIIIVESPSKSKTIQGYLGSGYTVLSSKGHICDLATTGAGGLGIDIKNGFIPNYVVMKDKNNLVKTLKKSCEGRKVYLATDPDREGEAIAYHLARVLNLDLNDLNRITFHEITKDAVKEALNNPQKIDIQMVDSQEARRMIDRILGFKLSKLLQKKIGSKSAGRVQSVALLLIVTLEKEILAFVPIKYYELEACFPTFKLSLIKLNNQIVDSKHRITDRAILENLKSRLLSFTVSNITSKQIKRKSYPTYTTSTLQQDASNKLGFTPTRTMMIAQSLYEGKNIGSETVGLITYMRTDSTRLADSFVKETNDFIIENYGLKYLGGIKLKSQKNMQDAHEGIRPTSILRRPEELKPYLSNDEYKLYNLIYTRTLASLMAEAVYNSTKVEFTNTDSVWSTTGSVLLFDGYQKVYGKSDDDSTLPQFKLGESFNADEINILDKETQPKSRYTEASLIKEMEEQGIGRPSTYAQTIQTLKDRKYINVEKKVIYPTEQGILTTEKLLEYFSQIINVKYTANMESDLDEIASGKKSKLDELNEFYYGFNPLFEEAYEKMEAKYPIMTDEICPKCGNLICIRLGKYGEFKACSNYPACDYKKADEENIDTNILCPICGKKNIIGKIAKTGINKGKLFYACANYPKCRTIFNDEPTNELCPNCNSIMLKDENGNTYCSKNCDKVKEFIKCPTCGNGNIVSKTATRGKNKGNIFYACSNYPKCKTLFNDEPTNEQCPKCNSIMLKDENGNLYCSKHCDLNSSEKEEIICPKCGKGHFVKRVAARGKNKGSEFYACSNYPRCKNIISIDEFNDLKNK